MKVALIVLAALAATVVPMIFFTAYICYIRIFRAVRHKPNGPDGIDLPRGKNYEPYYSQMIEWIRKARAMPHTDMELKSFDGLTLRGKYYEYRSGAPIEIMFHGYHGNAERDMCAGIERAFSMGRNALLVDQRGCGDSEGQTVSFGVNERRDCLAWVKLVTDRFGEDTEIILTGVSMGAATVMMAAGEELPPNVVCVLADCGYTSARDIIKKIMGEMHLWAGAVYPFARLGARVFGHFSLEETSPIEAMKKCRTPVIFIHGGADDFVPTEMSKRLFAACASEHKKLVVVPKAVHVLSYLTDKEGYIKALKDFEKEYKA